MASRSPRNQTLKKSKCDPQRLISKRLHRTRAVGRGVRVTKRKTNISRQRGRRLNGCSRRLYQRFQIITIGGRPVLWTMYFLKLQSGFVLVGESGEEIFQVMTVAQTPCPDDSMMDWSPTSPSTVLITSKGLHLEPEVDHLIPESPLDCIVNEEDTLCVVVLSEKDFLAGGDALDDYTFLEEEESESSDSEYEDEDEDEDGDEGEDEEQALCGLGLLKL
ncbi:hypothetical protein AOQ84DRAFT_369540 [Glonium stellatum]|uniref:Uncharacterized protein n=1 Tax=Glonium stellatum TaxID=574774 RepID=A0A8E2JM23_9PEZI|nr:hypothetical protein AOQ84DRAFT_369540 [Glonium stellatum]